MASMINHCLFITIFNHNHETLPLDVAINTQGY